MGLLIIPPLFLKMKNIAYEFAVGPLIMDIKTVNNVFLPAQYQKQPQSKRSAAKKPLELSVAAYCG